MNGLASSPFAHHYSGNRGCFLFLWVLRCFTSPRYLRLPYVFRQGRRAITPRQVSPFGNPRVNVWLPTNRGLSQVPTSFIGSWCQGIHRVPLLTWQLQMMLASTVQFSRYGRSRSPAPYGGEIPGLAEFGPACGASLRTQQRARPVQPPVRLSVPCRRAAACAAAQRAYSPDRAGCPNRITSAPLTSDHPGTNVRKWSWTHIPDYLGERASCSLE